MTETTTYTLGAARLYIAPAEVPEGEATSLKYYAGPTSGGVRLTYTPRLHEVKNWAGDTVTSIRYGEKITLTGKLSRLYPRVLAAATGSVYTDGTVYPGKSRRLARVRVVLLCDIPDEAGGGEAVFSFLAAAASPAAVHLLPTKDGGWDFSLTAQTDGAGLWGKWVIG